MDVIQPKYDLLLYFNSVEVLSIDDVSLDNVFDEMKEKDVYTFGEREWIALT